jgi:hypothetical protein
MANVLQEFVIALGWRIDPASQQRVIAQAQETAQQAGQQVNTQIQRAAQAHAATNAAVARVIALPVIGSIKAIGAGISTIQTAVVGLQRVADTTASVVGRTLKSSVSGVVGLAAVYVTGRGIAHLAADLTQLDNASRRTGSSVSNIRALDLAFRQIGGTSQDAMSSLEGVAQALRENPGRRDYFKTLGIDAQDTAGMITQMEKALQRFSISSALVIGKGWGLSEEAVRLLHGGGLSREFQEAQKILEEMGTNQDKVTLSSRLMAREWNNIGLRVEVVRDAFFGGAFGGGGGLLGGINRWLARDGGSLRKTFEELGDTVGTFIGNQGQKFVKWLSDLNDPNSKARQEFDGWKTSFTEFGAQAGEVGSKASALWSEFNKGSIALTGQGGLVTAFELLAAVMTGRVIVGLAGVAAALSKVTVLAAAATAAVGLGAGYLLNKYLTPEERDAVSKGGAGDQEHAGKPGDPTDAIISRGGTSIFERLWDLIRGGFERSTQNLNEAAKTLKEVGDKAGGGAGGVGMGGAGGTAGVSGGGDISTGGAGGGSTGTGSETAPTTPADTRTFAERVLPKALGGKDAPAAPSTPPDTRSLPEKILPKALGGKDAPGVPEDTRTFRERVLPKFLGGKDAPAAPAGSGSSVIGGRAARGREARAGMASFNVPDIGPMTDQERNNLGLILKYESRGKNVMNYMGRRQGISPTAPKGYTAQGYYQILNSNWQRIAPRLGINAPNAMAASLEDQTKVALALMREPGQKVGHWANYNPALRAALARGEKVNTANVPDIKPSAPERKIAARDTAEGAKPSGDIPVGETNKPGAIWKSPITGAIYKNDAKGLPSTVSKGDKPENITPPTGSGQGPQGGDTGIPAPKAVKTSNEGPLRDIVGKVGEAIRDVAVPPAMAREAPFAENKVNPFDFSRANLAPAPSSNDNSKNIEFNPIYNTTIKTNGDGKEAATAFQRAHEGLGGEALRSLTTAVR